MTEEEKKAAKARAGQLSDDKQKLLDKLAQNTRRSERQRAKAEEAAKAEPAEPVEPKPHSAEQESEAQATGESEQGEKAPEGAKNPPPFDPQLWAKALEDWQKGLLSLFSSLTQACKPAANPWNSCAEPPGGNQPWADFFKNQPWSNSQNPPDPSAAAANPWADFFKNQPWPNSQNPPDPSAAAANPWADFFKNQPWSNSQNPPDPSAAAANPWAAFQQPFNPSAVPPNNQGNPFFTPSPEPAPGLLSDPLVALKKSGSRPPLFLVAPIFGSAFPYHLLALHLDPEQPVYGLQSPGLDGKTEPRETIPDMARDYIAVIRRVQPHGPYYLGGYSFGGWVAFEIARQLIAAGERLAFLGMLGTPPPPQFAQPFQAKTQEYYNDWLECQIRLARDTSLSDQQRLDLKNAEPVLPLQRVAAANNRASMRYLPRPIDAGLSLFVTMDQLSLSPTDATLGWWLLCTREIDTQIHDGNHLNAFSEPHVRDLAAKLDARLKIARERQELYQGASREQSFRHK